LPLALSQTHVTQPLQVVHTDMWGPAPVLSHNGHRYYIHFIDEYTRFSWLYTCASKVDVFSIFTDFKLKVENQLSCTIKTIQCDGVLSLNLYNLDFHLSHSMFHL
jgi:hypothetical protein